MEVVSIERSIYEELLTSFNSFVIKMKEMASRGNDKRFFASKANKSSGATGSTSRTFVRY